MLFAFQFCLAAFPFQWLRSYVCRSEGMQIWGDLLLPFLQLETYLQKHGNLVLTGILENWTAHFTFSIYLEPSGRIRTGVDPLRYTNEFKTSRPDRMASVRLIKRLYCSSAANLNYVTKHCLSTMLYLLKQLIAISEVLLRLHLLSTLRKKLRLAK